ncbi:hypothetical protein [Pararhizobium haloflavum]|uniref:hypothetical protein n=1 Tax=Pararhizobium haloflavum TaxID=2037914 RepID=UPI000C17D590|nr:hypothetical protein [Pararhizobium haloflavum]
MTHAAVSPAWLDTLARLDREPLTLKSGALDPVLATDLKIEGLIRIDTQSGLVRLSELGRSVLEGRISSEAAA